MTGRRRASDVIPGPSGRVRLPLSSRPERLRKLSPRVTEKDVEQVAEMVADAEVMSTGRTAMDETKKWMVVGENRVELWGLTPREYVLAALEALDQAGVTPSQLATAYRHGNGQTERVLVELEL